MGRSLPCQCYTKEKYSTQGNEVLGTDDAETRTEIPLYTPAATCTTNGLILSKLSNIFTKADVSKPCNPGPRLLLKTIRAENHRISSVWLLPAVLTGLTLGAETPQGRICSTNVGPGRFHYLRGMDPRG